MKSIGVIVFYFGNYPWYHNYFIDSCKRNPSIDFLFFSDNVTEKVVEDNIRYFPFSISDFNDLASQKLGFLVTVKNGLKVCDFRPAFGLIFEDFITDYDYWGYSDTDIILGNLRNFLDDEALGNDYISVRDEYPSGFFSILKNSFEVNNLFKQSKDYRILFSMPENTLFEECGGAYNEVCNGVNILDSSCEYETFHHVLEKNKDSIKSLFEFYAVEGNVGNIIVKEEKLVFMKKFEIMIYHLTSYKDNLFSLIPQKVYKPTFYINGYNFANTKYGFDFSILKVYLKRFYLFRLANFFSKFTVVSENCTLISGTYIYMNDKLRISPDMSAIDLNSDESFKIKKILFYKDHYIFDNKIIIAKHEGRFKLVLLNGASRNFKFLHKD